MKYEEALEAMAAVRSGAKRSGLVTVECASEVQSDSIAEEAKELAELGLAKYVAQEMRNGEFRVSIRF